MIVGRLTISYDRGVARNAASDVNLDAEPTTTPDGGIVRGLGTHYRSQEARDNAMAWSAAERKVRLEFSRSFMSSPLPGVYVLPDRDAGRLLLQSLEIPLAVQARVSVYDLSPDGDLPPAEVAEWVERIRRQLDDLPLGRGKETSAAGLKAMESLIACPVLSEDTRNALSGLIAETRLASVERVEFKRRLADIPLTVSIAPVIAPRRPSLVRDLAPDAAEPVVVDADVIDSESSSNEAVAV